MARNAYREVLKLPHIPRLLLITLFSRLPTTAAVMTVTVHVVTNLGKGYGAAGLVGAMLMIGAAFGSPLFGRIVDGHGLRKPLLIWGLGCSSFWFSAAHLPYGLLVAAALPAGLLTLPIGSINRQVLTALVPPDKRKVAYTLDIIGLQLAFMVGPAIGIVLVAKTSSAVAFTCVALCFLLAASALFIANPPVRSADEAPVSRQERPSLRNCVSTRLVASLCVALGVTLCSVGNEVSVLATLRAQDQLSTTSIALSIMCFASAIGGFAYGAKHRPVSQFTLMFLVAGFSIPVAFAAMSGIWWLMVLALIPVNLASGPTLAANTESISAHMSPASRGLTMGFLDSATRIGLATGAPVIGFVIDRTSPHWGFGAAGGIGLLLLALAIALMSTTRKTDITTPEIAKPADVALPGAEGKIRVAAPAGAAKPR